MKLHIGTKLKELRRQRGITQERLAEALGVACQSVSRWELEICYPDIELLPAISNYFGITLDELAGMDNIRSEAVRNALFTDILELERQERWDEAAELLRDALRTYPNDDGFTSELALVLTKSSRHQAWEEAIMLSEQLLSRCTNEKLRSTTRANLCFLYQAAGQPDKAAAMGRTLPHIWECREILLPDLLPQADREAAVSASLDVANQVLRDVVNGKRIPFSLGYKPEGNEAVDSLKELLR